MKTHSLTIVANGAVGSLAFIALSLAGLQPAGGQTISTFAGRGPYTNADLAVQVTLPPPWPVAISPITGALYFATQGAVYSLDRGKLQLVAGNGSYGDTGDGGSATAASFSRATSITFDPSGNLYIAEPYVNRVRKVDRKGVITTFAGTGAVGYSGDGGKASTATLSFPFAVAADASGNVYIADYRNGPIRMVNTAGVISTVAGTEYSYPSGVTVDPSGAIYYLDQSGPGTALKKLTNGVPVLITSIDTDYNTEGLRQDAHGNLYTTHFSTGEIYKFSPSGARTVIAGTGTNGYSPDGTSAAQAQLGEPSDVVVDGAGAIYFTDFDNQLVRTIVGGALKTVAGNGVGDGLFSVNIPLPLLNGSVGSIATDRNSNLYFSQIWRVRKIDHGSGKISTYAGGSVSGYSGDGGLASRAAIRAHGIATDSLGNLFIADTGNNRIRKVDGSGIITTVAGNGAQGFPTGTVPALGDTLPSPFDVASNASGS